MNNAGLELSLLSPDSLELTEALLQSLQTFQRPSVAAPNTMLMVRYLSGALGPDAVFEVESGLVSRPRLRMRLVETRTLLDGLQALPWKVVWECAAGEGFEAEVAQAWLTLTMERQAAASSAPSRLAQGWERLYQQAKAGVAEAQAAWTALQTFGEWMKAEWQALGMSPAWARSSENRVYPGELPDGLKAFLHAEVETEGALRVSLVLQEAAGQPPIRERTIHLGVQCRGEILTLVSCEMVTDRAEWDFPDWGQKLGLSAGQTLPVETLLLAVGEDAALHAEAVRAEETRTLWATVVDAEGTPTPAEPVKIKLRQAPRWKEGFFTLEIEMSGWARMAYASYHLQLDLRVSDQDWQRLGEWLLSESPDGLLSVACPGSADGPLSMLLLRARLQAL